jgi:hypothetical protein
MVINNTVVVFFLLKKNVFILIKNHTKSTKTMHRTIFKELLK